MKMTRLVCLLVFSVASVAPTVATPLSFSGKADPVVPLSPHAFVAHGMARETVEHMLGQPGARLSANVWVYWDFKVRGAPPTDAYDSLVIGLTGDRVTFLRLSRSEPVRAFLARQEARALPAARAAP